VSFKSAHPAGTVVSVDVAALFHEVTRASNPFGFVNTTDAVGPLVPGSPFLAAVTATDPLDYLFYDGIHPTSKGHQLVGLEAAAGVYDALHVRQWARRDAEGNAVLEGDFAVATDGSLQINTAKKASAASLSTPPGAALYIAGGSVSLLDSSMSDNVAQASGTMIPFRWAEGGAVCVAGGTVTMRDDSVTGNSANGHARGFSGGLYIASAATVYLDAFTVANIVNNTASGISNDIYGAYTLIS
jgi:hypothetical protein